MKHIWPVETSVTYPQRFCSETKWSKNQGSTS